MLTSEDSGFVDLIFADDSNTYLPVINDTGGSGVGDIFVQSGTYHPSPNGLENNDSSYFTLPANMPPPPWGTNLSVFNGISGIGDWKFKLIWQLRALQAKLGLVDTWAYRWVFSLWQHKKFCITYKTNKRD